MPAIGAAYNVIYVLHLYEARAPNSGLLATLDPRRGKEVEKDKAGHRRLGKLRKLSHSGN
jgi:hypothetical protein